MSSVVFLLDPDPFFGESYLEEDWICRMPALTPRESPSLGLLKKGVSYLAPPLCWERNLDYFTNGSISGDF